jgi:exodeoxyribonuclease VII large subunit
VRAISVSELNNQIKSIIEPHFEIVYVRGEVSKVTYHSTGHLYFTIKDEYSSINCAMWKSNLKKMKFKLKEGDDIFVYGAVSLYVPRGEYKLIATEITPVGIGELQLAFDRLKEELNKLGYFDESIKKPLPKFPRRIAIVTSATGAAIQDMLRVAKKRWQLVEFYLFDTLVQGDGAAEDIAKNIKRADEFKFSDGRGFDLIIVGRGGGSKEDLWAFNERVVADAIFKASTPIVSAVGHEVDYLISDFVADKRAATPSNAIEIVLPDVNEILMGLDKMEELFRARFLNVLERKENNLNYLKELFYANSPYKKLDNFLKEIEALKFNFHQSIKGVINSKEVILNSLNSQFKSIKILSKIREAQREIEFLKRELRSRVLGIIDRKENLLLSLREAFKTLDPKSKKGVVEVVKNNKKVTLKDLKVDDIFYVVDLDNRIEAKVLKKE